MLCCAVLWLQDSSTPEAAAAHGLLRPIPWSRADSALRAGLVRGKAYAAVLAQDGTPASMQ